MAYLTNWPPGKPDDENDKPPDPPKYATLRHVAGYDHLIQKEPAKNEPSHPLDQLSPEVLTKAMQSLFFGKDKDKAADCIMSIIIEANIAEDQETIEWAQQWLDRILANYGLALPFFEALEKEPAKKPMMSENEARVISKALRTNQEGTQYQKQARTILWQIIGQILRGDRNRQRLDQARAMFENVNTDPAFAKQFVEELGKAQAIKQPSQPKKKNFWQR